MGVGRIFFREGPMVDFPKVAKRIFAGRPKVVEVHFNHSKSRKQPFSQKFDGKMSNFKIQKGALAPIFPPSDAHACL